MACPPGEGRGSSNKNGSDEEWCNSCQEPHKVCETCNRPIHSVNLSCDEGAENPQVDSCGCYEAVISLPVNTSPEPMDCDSPRISPQAQKSSGISLTTPSTSRSASRASPQVRQPSGNYLTVPSISRSASRASPQTRESSGISLTAPSTSSTAQSRTLETAREADKFQLPTGAKTKSEGSGSSKQSTPEKMSSSSDGYPLSSEERYNLRSNKVTQRGRKESCRGAVRKKKTSPEKTKEVKSESSPERFINLKRTTNMSAFGNSAENKISSKKEKMNTSGESYYTCKSSTQGGHSYNTRTFRNKYYASPESDNTNNDRVYYSINVVPPVETPNLSSQQNESNFTSYKENVPFRQGYRPSLPRPFPQNEPQPSRLPIPVQRHPTFPGRFGGPNLGTSRYQQPYAEESHDHSVIGLPRGQKLDDEKVENQQKFERVKDWLQTVEPFSSNDDDLVNPPTPVEATEREEQGAVGIASSNPSAAETSCTEIYDVNEFSKMSESEETDDDSKKTRRKKL